MYVHVCAEHTHAHALHQKCRGIGSILYIGAIARSRQYYEIGHDGIVEV